MVTDSAHHGRRHADPIHPLPNDRPPGLQPIYRQGPLFRGDAEFACTTIGTNMNSIIRILLCAAFV